MTVSCETEWWEVARRWVETVLLAFVALVAVYGDRLKNWLAGPRLSLEVKDPKGSLTFFTSGSTALFHHLIVKNTRKVAANKVRVLLQDAYFKPEGEDWHHNKFSPSQFLWTPAEQHNENPMPTIYGHRELDFGCLTYSESTYAPRLALVPNNFLALLEGAGSAIYCISIEADNFFTKEPFYIKVDWDGQLHPQIDLMANHLAVCIIKSSEFKKIMKEAGTT